MSRVRITERSVEKTHVWLNELSEELGTDQRGDLRHAGDAPGGAAGGRPRLGR